MSLAGHEVEDCTVVVSCGGKHMNESMKENFSAKLDEKQAVVLTEESKRLE